MFREPLAPAGYALLHGSSRVHFFQKVPHNLRPRDDYFRPAPSGAQESHRYDRISRMGTHGPPQAPALSRCSADRRAPGLSPKEAFDAGEGPWKYLGPEPEGTKLSCHGPLLHPRTMGATWPPAYTRHSLESGLLYLF